MSNVQPIPGFERTDLGPPSIDEFDMLRCGAIGIIEVADEEDVISFEDVNCRGRAGTIRRLVFDPKTNGLELKLEARTMHAYTRRSESVWIALGTTVFGMSGVKTKIVNEYNLRLDGGQFAEGYHDVYVEPAVVEPQLDPDLTYCQQRQANIGAKILRENFGRNMELTVGDCYIAQEGLDYISLPRMLYLPE